MKRLPALEKNILIYRALQMVQFLFYSETIREQLVSSVGRVVNEKLAAPLKGAKLLKAVFEKLEHDGVMTSDEILELQSLLEHRNVIAHNVYKLTGDIVLPGSRRNFKRTLDLNYDYHALEKLKVWDQVIWRKLNKDYWLLVSPGGLMFEAAEQAYESELKRLEKRIDRQFVERKKKVKQSKNAQE